MRKIDKEVLVEYLKEKHDIENPNDILNGKVEHRDILNELFETFTDHWYDHNIEMLVTPHPNKPNRCLGKSDYDGFSHLKSFDEVADEMKKIIVDKRMALLEHGDIYERATRENMDKEDDLER